MKLFPHFRGGYNFKSILLLIYNRGLKLLGSQSSLQKFSFDYFQCFVKISTMILSSFSMLTFGNDFKTFLAYIAYFPFLLFYLDFNFFIFLFLSFFKISSNKLKTKVGPLNVLYYFTFTQISTRFKYNIFNFNHIIVSLQGTSSKKNNFPLIIDFI